ncbi:MAG TPA: alpha/beta hydrolase [Povalibacter sp.]
MDAQRRSMLRKVASALKWPSVVLGAVLLTLLAVRAYDARGGPSLESWHTFVPDELKASELAHASWSDYLAAENRVFDEVRTEVTEQLGPADRVPANRYYADSPMYAERFTQDWNRSFILTPDDPPVGVVALFHGLTDSPYSVRHLARFYRQRGYVAVAIRLPGHGTVPGGLARVSWQDWVEASRLAVREARRLGGDHVPLHIVGYSNGGTVAIKYALDALEDQSLTRPDRVVLLSPMIGVTRLARFAGVLGWPAVFPAFAKAAWLDILPEYNPFKYNSFPVNAARQSSLFTDALQEQITRLSSAGRLAQLAPVTTFQSVLDQTVSTPAVVDGLYAHLPDNGSELVLFDLNHNAEVRSLLRPESNKLADNLLPPAPRRFRTTIISNAGTDDLLVSERVTPPGSTDTQTRPLELSYPRDVYSLSHIALPFPLSDSLYGSQPDQSESYGLHLGTIATRGERSSLIISLDTLIRMSSNPFFPYLLERVDEGMNPATASLQ